MSSTKKASKPPSSDPAIAAGEPNEGQGGTPGGSRGRVLGRRPIQQPKGLIETILERRATNHFEPDAVPLDTVNYLLQLAGQAPSGYNLQPWRFIVVRTEAGRRRLRMAAMDQEKITEAPLVIIAVGMKQEPLAMAEEILREGARRGAGSAESVARTAAQARRFLSEFPMDVWVNRHTMIAVTFLILAAEACGFDTAPMEGFDPAAVRREFNVPEEGEIVALVAIGKMRKPDKAYPGRLPISRIAFQESFGLPWREELLSAGSDTKPEERGDT